MKLFKVAAVGLVMTWSLSARAEDSTKKPERPPVQSTGGAAGVKDAGSVKGVARFTGAKPAPKPVADIAGNAFCKECYKDAPLPNEDKLVFGKNGDGDALANVLVYVSKGLEGKAVDVPKEPVVIDQIGCVYVPHVVAVMAGQTLEVRNTDATLHNVMAAPRKNAQFNFGMAGGAEPVNRVFKEPEFKVNLKCFMHPWMSGYVHVLPHPYFAVSGPDGAFAIQGLPPGEYELTVLHETSAVEAKAATATVKVTAGATAEASFTFAMKVKKE
jgi:plastocyanin